ncbi:DUF3326 domain-containing protein [Pirellulales bacterium]|nr:DUF3326 domain-containing protein [Pirellulales bacterium]
MLLSELELQISAPNHDGAVADHVESALSKELPDGFVPVRFAVVESSDTHWRCEIGGISQSCETPPILGGELFRCQQRHHRREEFFNVALVVPTGIGASLGGHAGDVAPVVRMLSAICDELVTHPNVVNASDIIELPDNCLYVEGSVLTRLLMGTVGLEKARANRILAVLGDHLDRQFIDATINSVNAARACYGLSCDEIVILDTPLTSRARYTNSGRAAGRVENIQPLLDLMEKRRGTFDAVAISSVIDVPPGFHEEYFASGGNMVNPWGGVEALLTHAVSFLENIPSAHSPMMESEKIAYMDVPRVDPRMAAEAVSMTFFNCVLKGLQRSPRVVTDRTAMMSPGVMSAADISCLVIPDGCLGLPTLAALQQGIPVIAVRENTNLMRNDLTSLPWAAGQFFRVENYWEAAGVLAAMKAGVDPRAVRRPLDFANVTDCRNGQGTFDSEGMFQAKTTHSQ